jgi:hypothetical protein
MDIQGMNFEKAAQLLNMSQQEVAALMNQSQSSSGGFFDSLGDFAGSVLNFFGG